MQFAAFTPFKWITSFILSFSLTQLFAYADLVVIQPTDFSPKTIKIGELLTLNAVIKNIGDVPSDESYCALIASTTSNFSTSVTEISITTVKKLNPGESVTIQMVYPNPLPFGEYYIALKVDAYDDVIERDEKNTFLINSKLNVLAQSSNSIKIPYPIIFIHGLTGDGNTWNPFTDNLDAFYGLEFGGQMNFCLNADNNVYTSIISTDYKNFNSPISVGDYYYINFAVRPNGTTYPAKSKDTYTYQSNQSAIKKQGIAVKDAIQKVLAITGKDYVILVGHSMGGLAAREYLQNSSNWQTDGKHHVAKLFTIGTPHGGSNTSSLGINIFDNVDEKSEAVRDLRYPNGIYTGKFLFGGTESSSIGFSNDDINCNGIVADYITGLNYKSLPKDLSYACTIGKSSILKDDGVVDDTRANINNYPSGSGVQADTFVDRVSPIVDFTQHTELHQRTQNNMKGLDEPYLYRNSYIIKNGQLYFGFITEQSESSPYKWDYDDYKIQTTQKGNLRVQAFNLPVHDFDIDILNSALQKVCRTISSNSKSNIDTTINNLPSDTYYIEISGYPTATSYFYPYALKVTSSQNTPTLEVKQEDNISIYPNPSNGKFNIDIKNTPSVSSIEIINTTGVKFFRQIIYESNTSIDAQLTNGLYLINIYDSENNIILTKKLVVNN